MTSEKLDIKANLKAVLREKGFSQKELAREIGAHPVVINDVIHNRRPNPKVREAIAKSLNKPIADLWPEQEQA